MPPRIRTTLQLFHVIRKRGREKFSAQRLSQPIACLRSFPTDALNFDLTIRDKRSNGPNRGQHWGSDSAHNSHSQWKFRNRPLALLDHNSPNITFFNEFFDFEKQLMALDLN
jgi:hypothetical protein